MITPPWCREKVMVYYYYLPLEITFFARIFFFVVAGLKVEYRLRHTWRVYGVRSVLNLSKLSKGEKERPC